MQMTDAHPRGNDWAEKKGNTRLRVLMKRTGSGGVKGTRERRRRRRKRNYEEKEMTSKRR